MLSALTGIPRLRCVGRYPPSWSAKLREVRAVTVNALQHLEKHPLRAPTESPVMIWTRRNGGFMADDPALCRMAFHRCCNTGSWRPSLGCQQLLVFRSYLLNPIRRNCILGHAQPPSGNPLPIAFASPCALTASRSHIPATLSSISRVPPGEGVAITGVPQASASRATLGNASWRDESTKASECAIQANGLD